MRSEYNRLGKMSSKPEAFSIPVKATKESFGEASRSGSAPTEIEMLLAQIREAEAEGRPSEALHQQLLEAVTTFRRNAMARKAAARQQMPRSYQPSRTLVITGKRGRPGVERAQVMVDGRPVNLVAEGQDLILTVTHWNTLRAIRRSSRTLSEGLPELMMPSGIRLFIRITWLGRVQVHPHPSFMVRMLLSL